MLLLLLVCLLLLFFYWLSVAALIMVFSAFLCLLSIVSLSLIFSIASSWWCRLENKASILDLRVECQDLEKFSVINRFAKFHGRGQVDGAETSASSDTATNAQKPQRYVTALPMPRNLPDRVQCLSLWSLINWFFPLSWSIVSTSLMLLWSIFFQLI